MPRTTKRHYDSIRDTIDTGDVVLFSGKGGISAGIKWFTSSRWSHVGMALRLPEFNLLLLWESTTLSDIADLDTGKLTQGVQLVPLSERLKRYGGDAAVRLLNFKDRTRFMPPLQKLRAELKGRPYEKSTLDLLRAAYDGPFGENLADLSSLFCSELVAEAYQRMGLLPDDPVADEYTPHDFSSAKPLPLQGGARLSEEIFVTA